VVGLVIALVLLLGAALLAALGARFGACTQPPASSASPGASTVATVPDKDRQAVEIGLLLGGDLLFDLAPGDILIDEGPEAVLGGWAALRRRDGIDLGVANLECPLTDRGAPLPGKKYTFAADHPEDTAAALRQLGFDVVSLANNHILDYGQVGLADTTAALSRAGVGWAGAGSDRAAAYAPALVERDGLRIAILAFGGTEYMPAQYQAWWAAGDDHPGIAPLLPQADLLAAVARARADVDLLVVSLHWGLEYAEVTAAQRELGRAVIEAGADVVFGHHPHVVQPVEFWQGRPILYSLGNLAFHAGQPLARQMVAAELQFSWDDVFGKHITIEVRLHALVNRDGRTEPMPAPDAVSFLAGIAQSCRQLGTPAALDGSTLVLTPDN
jgi:poly-gamma-glutamate synthesis protein (capsule biosynthesis protein)